MENDLLLLKNEPSASEIDRIVTDYLSEDHGLQLTLQFVSTLLKHITPIYQSLKTTIRLKIRQVFYSCVGISNLLNFYKLTKNGIYLKLMKDLLVDQKLLVSVIESCKGNKNELNQVKSLFVGSKIFQTFEGEFEIEKYLDLVTKQLIEACKADLKVIHEFINSFLSLHPIDAKFVFFNQFFNDNYLGYLVDAYFNMARLQKKIFLWRSLIPYLERHVSINNLETIIKILSRFDFSQFEEYVITNISEIDNVNIQHAVSAIVNDYKSVFGKLLTLWGNEQFIKEKPYSAQQAVTKELLILLNYMTPHDCSEFVKDRLFLDAITARISSNDNLNRELGMTIAKRITNGEIKFDVDDEISVGKISKPNLASKIDFTDLFIGDSMQNLTLSTKKDTKIADSDDESDVLDNDEDSEEEIETLFLKDLIRKFNDERINSITKLLSHTIKLIRQKATFKMEIEFYSEELISLLIGLINKYDEVNFEQLKINSIVSVIVVNPKIISHVMNLLFTGDYSLQQRMIILSSISLSSRELRGLDDDFIEKPISDFPTRKIEQRHKPTIEEITPSYIEEITDVPDESFIGQGTVTRKSRTLTKPKEKSKPNTFAKLAPKFFYPLANGWIEGINVGGYNELFLKHYLQTLELVIKAAYPCNEFEDMFVLYNEILEDSGNISI